MDDGTILDTDNAKKSWDEDTYFDGNNHISRATGSQWGHETLRCSRKGRYYVERTSQWQGSHPSAEWVSDRGAATWLLANGHELPADLAELEAEIVE
jgi:hypothetical protein